MQTHVSHSSSAAAMNAGAWQVCSMLWPLVVTGNQWGGCFDLEMQQGRPCTMLHCMPAAVSVCCAEYEWV